MLAPRERRTSKIEVRHELPIEVERLFLRADSKGHVATELPAGHAFDHPRRFSGLPRKVEPLARCERHQIVGPTNTQASARPYARSKGPLANPVEPWTVRHLCVREDEGAHFLSARANGSAGVELLRIEHTI